MYEDIQDIKFIDSYIEKTKHKKHNFISGDELFD
jgi:hypothetical protein